MAKTAKKHFELSANKELTDAVRSKDYDKVRELLENGVNVESIDPDDNNKTPLHIACDAGDMKMIRLLEEFKCEFEA